MGADADEQDAESISCIKLHASSTGTTKKKTKKEILKTIERKAGSSRQKTEERRVPAQRGSENGQSMVYFARGDSRTIHFKLDYN